MLRLYILRHAKSSWSLPGRSDFDRPLNRRGRSDLPKLAAAIVQRNYLPQAIYCSSAARTRETIAGILAKLPAEQAGMEIHYADELYSGSLENYLGVLAAHDTPQPLMIVGHNPTCEMLAFWLTGGETGSSMIHIKYPTGAIAVIDIPVDRWSDIDKGTGTLVDFVRPRDL